MADYTLRLFDGWIRFNYGLVETLWSIDRDAKGYPTNFHGIANSNIRSRMHVNGENVVADSYGSVAFTYGSSKHGLFKLQPDGVHSEWIQLCYLISSSGKPYDGEPWPEWEITCQKALSLAEMWYMNEKTIESIRSELTTHFPDWKLRHLVRLDNYNDTPNMLFDKRRNKLDDERNAIDDEANVKIA